MADNCTFQLKRHSIEYFSVSVMSIIIIYDRREFTRLATEVRSLKPIISNEEIKIKLAIKVKTIVHIEGDHLPVVVVVDVVGIPPQPGHVVVDVGQGSSELVDNGRAVWAQHRNLDLMKY